MTENTIQANKTTWSQWDWSDNGEVWTPSIQWKHIIIDRLIVPHMKKGGTILEIGPGGGRWSETLVHIADRLILVDLCAECIEHCKKRFSKYTHVHYFENSGNDLSCIPDASIDSVFAFDVFVHINPEDTAKYIAEFQRVLRPGGIGVIHHARNGKAQGWRSDMTADLFAKLLAKHMLHCNEQFNGWDEKNNRITREKNPDIFTVFSKPADE